MISHLIILSSIKIDEYYKKDINNNKAIAFLLIIIIFCSIFFILSFIALIFHIYLIFSGQTTIELLKKTYRKIKNPFDKGYFKNFLFFLIEDGDEKNRINLDYLLERQINELSKRRLTNSYLEFAITNSKI